MFQKVFARVSLVGNVIASVFLAGITFLMVGEITGRYVFNSPIPGTWEIVAGAMVVLTSIGFAFALEQRRHIVVIVFSQRLPLKLQHYLTMLSYLVGFFVTGVLTWQLTLMAIRSVVIREYEGMGILPIPIYPTKIIFVFAVLLFCVGFLKHFGESIRGRR